MPILVEQFATVYEQFGLNEFKYKLKDFLLADVN